MYGSFFDKRIIQTTMVGGGAKRKRHLYTYIKPRVFFSLSLPLLFVFPSVDSFSLPIVDLLQLLKVPC